MSGLGEHQSGRTNLQFVLSFDVENKYDGKTDLITAENVPESPGVRWIMDQLESRGLVGVFFVNIYEHEAYEPDYFPSLLKEIHARGHEVGLHMHHESLLKQKEFKNYKNLSREQKFNLLNYGVEYFVQHLGEKPVSYRAGAYIIDDESLDILAELGLKVDSSLCFGYNKPGNNWYSNKNLIDGYSHIQQPHQIRSGLWEFPVTTIGRSTEFRNLSFDHFHAISLKSILEQLGHSSVQVAVMVAHSFSMLKFGETKRDVEGPDQVLMESFRELLDFISSSEGIETTTFVKLLEQDMDTRALGGSYVPQVERRWIGRKIWDQLIQTKAKWGKPDHSTLMQAENVEPNRGKTVWLHIGTWKTGTTSIQRFLRNNSEWLEANDFHLPIQDALLNSPAAKNLCNHRPVISKDPEVLKALKQAVMNCAQKHMILTSENMVYANREALQYLRVALAGCDVKIVIYLRRQDQYTQSLYGQHIRGGVKTTLSFEEHLKLHDAKYRYDEMLKPFVEIFGADSITVRPYEKSQFKNNDLIDDFTSTIGLPDMGEDSVKLVPPTNFPYSIPALEFIRRCNKSETNNRALLVKLLGEYSQQQGDMGIYHTHNWISGVRQMEIINDFAANNENVARQFLGREDGQLFYDSLPQKDELGYQDSDTADDILEISTYLWQRLNSTK